jgi:hypothetical protein
MKQVVIRIPFFGRTLALHIRTWIAKISTHYGVTNQTSDGYFIPMWDFAEDRDLEDVMRSLSNIQDEFGLSTIYVFQTYPTESYRAVCFDKLIFVKAMGIICMTNHIDHQYLRFSWIRMRCVLRLTSKVGKEERLVGTLPSMSAFEKSLDHQAIFSKFYEGIPRPHLFHVRVSLSKYESFR